MDDEGLPLIQRHTVNDSWALNTYGSCDVRCRYCITSAQGHSVPRVPADEVGRRLGAEIDAIADFDRLVVGPYSDVYPGPEAALGVTRNALAALAERTIDFRLVTKGTTVLRDIEFFGHPRTQIQISLSTLDEGAVGRLEPGAASAAARLAVLHELAASDVNVLLRVSPWIPEVTDLSLLLAAVDPGITIWVTPLRLPPYLGRASRYFGLTQSDVNDAYRTEYDRIGARPNLRWSRLPPLDGAPLHISSNLGRRELHDWAPAPRAPDPGLAAWW